MASAEKFLVVSSGDAVVLSDFDRWQVAALYPADNRLCIDAQFRSHLCCG